MDVSVELAEWEQACCGSAIERQQVVALRCKRYVGPDGETILAASRHDNEHGELIQGRVTDLHIVLTGGCLQRIRRVPCGEALRGFDPDDDGHLEDPWTGEVLSPEVRHFFVTVRMD